jgi:hypothetical protein
MIFDLQTWILDCKLENELTRSLTSKSFHSYIFRA